jgi:hypothetical protein
MLCMAHLVYRSQKPDSQSLHDGRSSGFALHDGTDGAAGVFRVLCGNIRVALCQGKAKVWTEYGELSQTGQIPLQTNDAGVSLDVSRDARVRNSLTVLQVGQAEEEAVILQAIVVHLHLKQPRLHILPLKILAGSRSPSALTRCRNSASAMSGTSMPATATYRRLAELPHLPRSDQPRRSNDQHDRPIRRIPRVEQDKGPASVRELGRVGPPSVTPLEMVVSVSAGSAERSD